ncbi:hypothetical protein Tco_0038399 [Tanacetum coccineum]
MHEIWWKMIVLIVVHMICDILVLDNKDLDIVEQQQQVLMGAIFKIVSTTVRSRTSGESFVAGTTGIMTVEGVEGPSSMHFLKASPFGLVSMYLKKRDYYCAYLRVASIGGRSLDPTTMVVIHLTVGCGSCDWSSHDE